MKDAPLYVLAAVIVLRTAVSGVEHASSGSSGWALAYGVVFGAMVVGAAWMVVADRSPR